MMRDSRETTIKKELVQVTRYADQCEADEVYLLIFDREKDKYWEEKIFYETTVHEDIQITIFGM